LEQFLHASVLPRHAGLSASAGLSCYYLVILVFLIETQK